MPALKKMHSIIILVGIKRNFSSSKSRGLHFTVATALLQVLMLMVLFVWMKFEDIFGNRWCWKWCL